MKKITDKFAFANGLELKNPVCMAPMTTYSGDGEGFFSTEEINYYKARSKDVGMIITGCAAVSNNGYGWIGYN